MKALHAALLALAALPFLIFVGGETAAQTVPIDETRPLRAGATVDLKAVSHSVRIEPWDRDEIRIRGSYESDWEHMSIRERDGEFQFEIRHTDRRGSWSRSGSSGELTVQLPRGVRLRVETVSGRVQARGDFSLAELSAISGSVEYAGNASSVRLSAVSGSTSYQGEADEVRLSTVSGGATVEGAAHRIETNAVSGRVRVTSTRPVQRLTMNSVSGGVAFTGALEEGGSVRAQSHSGPVELTFTSAPDARFDLSTFSGRIDASLAGMRDEVHTRARFTPNESLTFTVGAGSGRVEASSFSGRLVVRSGSR